MLYAKFVSWQLFKRNYVFSNLQQPKVTFTWSWVRKIHKSKTIDGNTEITMMKRLTEENLSWHVFELNDFLNFLVTFSLILARAVFQRFQRKKRVKSEQAVEYLRYDRSDVAGIIGLDDLLIHLEPNIRHAETTFDIFIVWKCSLIDRLADSSKNLHIVHHSKWHR